MRSMTGFARVDSSADWGRIEIELRSVNQRHLDINFQLVPALRHLEPQLREALRGHITRGKLDITLRYFPEQQASSLQVDVGRLTQLRSALEVVEANIFGIAQPTTVDILNWPGVIAPTNPDTQAQEKAALVLFDQALDQLEAAREREGARLKEMIIARLEGIAEHVASVRTLLPEITERQRTQLAARATAAGLELDEHRLGAELALLVQRADVTEELDRLESHVKEMRHQLGNQGPIGRRLDFLVQEFNREANTLGSKSVVTETTHRAVELKVLIEQIREQVQNVE